MFSDQPLCHTHLRKYPAGKTMQQPLSWWFLRGFLLLFLLSAGGCSWFSSQDAPGPALFLGWDSSGTAQLFRYEYGTKLQQLTSFNGGVFDYAASPDGRHIILSTNKDKRDDVLWIMEADGSSQRELYTCSQAECAKFAWVQDSRRLLFERRDLDDKGIAASPTLWWLDTRTLDILPVQEDESRHGAYGRLSPDGQWLSYHSPENEGLTIYNLQDEQSRFITNEIGTAAEWSPDSRHLVAPMLDLVILHGEDGEDHETHTHRYQTAVHLQRLDLESGERLNISGDGAVEDSMPDWSPDGQWIAFGRRVPGTDAARQLWVMRADGSEARGLTDDPAINHGPPTWSPDGRYILFQQIAQNDPAADPEIWRISVDSGEKEQLAPSGMQPQWLPPTG